MKKIALTLILLILFFSASANSSYLSNSKINYGVDNQNVTIPIINWNNPADITYGTALSSTQLNAIATNPTTGTSVPGTFNYNPAAGTVLSAGTNILRVDFTPTDTTNYTTASKDVIINVISVSPPPTIVADFNSNITSGKLPLKVRFNDLSTGYPTSWYWDFGDGTAVNGNNNSIKSPGHTYTTVGTYTVTLRASNGTSWGTVTKTNYITVGNGLQAVFTASSTQGVAPLTVQFTDNSIGAPTAWLWDFGDGTSSTLQSPAHIYNMPGSYVVKLTVSNNIDTNTSIPFLVNVSLANTPVANFNSNLSSGRVPLTVQFNDTSTKNPTAWEWDFNSDGVVDSIEQNPVYIFKDPGSYNITLKASNLNGSDNVTKINYITVSEEELQADFTASPVEGDAPLTVQFTDNSKGNVTSWYWDFGDGSNSTSKNPSHTYSGSGSYTVTLNVSNMKENKVLTLSGYITVTEGSGGSSSGGGGSGSTGTGSLAGTGGSPEPASNVEVKLQTQRCIVAGNHIKFGFKKGVTHIDCIEFDAKRTLGKTTATVEQLKGRSVLTPIDPEGKIYKYLNIWVGNNGIANLCNIENATVEFTVNRSEVNETEKSPIILQMYADGGWSPLNTNKIGEDGQYIYYQANTTGFSAFAITSGEIKSIQKNETRSETQYNDTISVPARQLNKTEAADNTTDWHKYSGIVRFFVLFIVVLFIGLAIREKRK